MIPEDFKDFFISSSALARSEIVSMLLAISTDDRDLTDSDQGRAISCPHCKDVRIKTNGKLKGVQRYVCNGCHKNFSETTGKFWYWQVSFYVPHDMPGLVELYGGKEQFEEKLDSLFTLPWNPDHIARNISSFIGQYCHGNQPDHEAPFSYYFVDKPEKSQKIIDTILENYYGVGKEGLALSGMDDAGEMSAWYVFSAMGLYPLSPADNNFLLTVPVFDQVRWELENGKKVDIDRHGNSRKLKSISVNGKSLDGYFLPYQLFQTGGEVDIQTK